LKKETEGIKTDVSSLKKDNEELKGNVNSLKDGQQEIKHKINSVYDQVAWNAELLSQTATKKDLENINGRLDYQLSRVAKNEEDIHFLKQQK